MFCEFFPLSLFKCTLTQDVDFFLCEVTPTSAGQIFLGKTGEIYAVQFGDAVTEMLENAAYDAVATGMDLDAGLVALVAYIADCVGMDFSVVKLYAVGDTLHVVLADFAVGPYVIDLLLDVFGVCEFRSKVAVVGEKQHTGGVAVQTSHGIDAFGACVAHYVEDSGAAVRIVACRDAVLRFVEKNVALAFGSNNFVIIFHHVIASDLGSKFCHYVAVDLYFPCLYVFIGFPAAAETGVGHVFVQANFSIRIDVFQNIIHLFGTRSELAFLITLLLIVATLETTLLAILEATLTVLEAALLGTLLIAALLTLLVAALLVALLIAALLTVLVTSLLGALLVASLLIALLVAVLLIALLVAALLTLLIVALLAALLIPSLTLVVVRSLLVASLLISVRTLLIGPCGLFAVMSFSPFACMRLGGRVIYFFIVGIVIVLGIIIGNVRAAGANTRALGFLSFFHNVCLRTLSTSLPGVPFVFVV